MTLNALPGLLSGEAAIAELLSADDAIVAVAEPARAIVLAAMAELSSAPVMLVATPTAREADQLEHDLVSFVGRDHVDVLPAWETLPFERVSPASETMGRRLRAMWRLRQAHRDVGTGGATAPRVVIAPIRALLQQLGPRVDDVEPIVVERGKDVDAEGLVARLVHAGYRREYQVEHRGELAVRGGIIDVFPSTDDRGIRIDLWGDEVERLTRFDVSDQRSVAELDQVEIFGCRELVLTDEVRARARQLAADSPIARDVFERIADGLLFDGMESWLPWLTHSERLFTDLLDPDARVVLVDPRRLRDRASELIAEETALADTLASTWTTDPGVPVAMAHLHLPFDRLLSKTGARLASLLPTADRADTTVIAARSWPPVLGDAAGLARRLGELARSGHRVVICADGRGSADRLAAVLDGEGLETKLLADPGPEYDRALRQPGVHIVVAPLDRGALLPDSKLAILAEPDITGRRRPHRVARPRARAVEGFFDDLEPGAFVVHHVHGVARYGGLVKRAIGGSERDYLLLEYRGGDRLYVPSDQIDSITPYAGGDHPTLNRLNGNEWQRQKSRVRAAVRQIAKELVALYRRRAT
ncbi:MAG TPA: CarD family transcriptional regulator, partial [Acidimicrobiales bacterium]|nr:CarD family transcriptional regulator [Acidimicrobiales bacterium]